MPQLDSYMYFSQVFWLIIFFVIFYILIVNRILPKIAQSLKLRSKQNEVKSTSSFNEEDKKVIEKTSNILESSLKDSTLFLTNLRSSTNQWLESSLNEANEEKLLEINKAYLKRIADLKGQSLSIKDIINKK